MSRQGNKGRSVSWPKRSPSWQPSKSLPKSNLGLQRIHPAHRIHEIQPLRDHLSLADVTNASSTPSPVLQRILYDPLNNSSREFRLLALRPGSGRAHISCRLYKSDLSDFPVFEALSYTWADPIHLGQPPGQGNNQIEVNGHKFLVHMNLMLALSYLRYPLEPRTFWIDAICINQSNIDEKNQQVGLMKKIYRRAHSVIAWLGLEDRDSSRVMEFATKIKLQQDLDERRQMVFQELRDRSYNFGQAYTHIFQRSYWYRTWIIQEIFSAKQLSIQCGPLVVTWDSLVALHAFLIDEYHGFKRPSGQVLESMNDLHLWVRGGATSRRRLGRYISSGERFLDLSRLRESRLRSRENEERRKLHKLLFENWDAVASDPLDKVFAILGLASDSDDYEIVVDYSLTVNEVYTTVVENYIRIYGNLSIILPRRFRDNLYYLPTWCPDWSSPATQLGSWKDAYPFQVAEYNRPYCAAGLGSQAIVRFSVRGQFMITRGWRLDTIQHRSNSRSIPPPRIEEKPSFWEHPLVLFCLCFPRSRHPRSSTIRKASDFDIWYAMHRRKLHSHFNSSTRRHTRSNARFRHYCRRKHREFFFVLLRATNLFVDDRQRGRTAGAADHWRRHGDIPESLSSNLSEVMTPALQQIAEDLGEIKINENYTCFFITRSGFMGLGPRDMRDDDTICILRGSDFPVILRWNGFAFRLLGSCYVVGVMHGQFVSPQWGSRPAEEEFEIC